MIESQGPASSIGDVCLIHTGKQKKVKAEVVGFRDEIVILMPYSAVSEIAPGSLVEATRKPLEIKVGKGLIGKALDAIGNPLDGGALPYGLSSAATEQNPPNPMSRPPINQGIETGVRMIDSLLTVGKGLSLIHI